jgi:acyl carrier protein
MPDRESIRKSLIDLLEADTGEQYPNLDDNTNLREGLGLDSVDVVSVVSQIERQYRIRLTHQDLESLATVADVLNLLERKLVTDAEPPAAGSEAPAA